MSPSETVLVVDDQPDFARGLARLIGSRRPDCEVLVAAGGQDALETISARPVDLLVTDLRMPSMHGQELLERALDMDPLLTVVMLTAHGDVESAVAALKAGAYDFLTKPVDSSHLIRVVGKALERAALLRENKRLRESVAASEAAQELIGESPSMLRLKQSIVAVAQSDYTVLILGESGTGKELVARTIHRLSRRAPKPMLTLNCPAIPEQLLESELFGHEKGAFTGADKSRQGLFLAASGGTLLLDEIGDIGLNVQTKLLRVLQEREVRPLGGSKAVPVDTRILASTNQNLEAKIKDRTFRDDLFYRLNVLTIETPPLRERREDIPLLVAHFLVRAGKEMGTCPKEVNPEVLACIASQPWHGNVRELENFVRRMVVFSPGPVIDPASARVALGCKPVHPHGPRDSCLPGRYQDAKARALDAFTRSYVDQLLGRTKGNISEAARLSGLERVSLQKILKRLGMEAKEFKKGDSS
ncbi:sigma-54 dependent transcriptional regulator [Fundidesulfovibrio butyratiphilus]